MGERGEKETFRESSEDQRPRSGGSNVGVKALEQGLPYLGKHFCPFGGQVERDYDVTRRFCMFTHRER